MTISDKLSEETKTLAKFYEEKRVSTSAVLIAAAFEAVTRGVPETVAVDSFRLFYQGLAVDLAKIKEKGGG